MTMSQKIIAKKAGLDFVSKGQLVMADVDMILANDITAPVAINEFENYGNINVFNKDKIALVADHFVPNKDIKSAEQAKKMRDFAQKQSITHYYETGCGGIEHVLLPEKGLTLPGELIIGADSHTCTYGALGAFSTGMGSTDIAAAMITGKTWLKVPEAIKINICGNFNKYVSGKDLILNIIGKIGVDGALYKSLEFMGDGVKNLSMDDRFTICNMAIEAGAKNAVFPVDETTKAYLKERSTRKYDILEADEDAQYSSELDINLSDIKLTVALPHLPSNTAYVDELPDITIDQVVIGSCTNGRYSDLEIASNILDGKQVCVRTIVFPGTQEVYLKALKNGIIEKFIKA